MRVQVTSRNIRRRPSVQALAQGGYAVNEMPDPNNGMQTFERNNPQAMQGAHGMATAAGNPMNDGRRPISLAMLDSAANAQDQGDTANYNAENQRQVVEGQMTQAEQMGRAQQDRMNKTRVAVMDPNARRYTQALTNAGAGNLKAGAVHEPDVYQGSSFGVENTAHGRSRETNGFFNEQDSNNLQRQSLTALLRAKDLNSGRGY